MSFWESSVPLITARNVRLGVEGSKVRILSDLSQRIGNSTHNKSVVVASSRGRAPIGTTGAYFTLNVYHSIHREVKLDDDTLEPLRNEWIEGSFCRWGIIEGTVLCFEIDFNNVGTTSVARSRSVSLASTRGIRALGDTGFVCLMSCLSNAETHLDISRLHSITKSNVCSVGTKLSLGGGFELIMERPTQATVRFDGLLSSVYRGVRIAPFVFNEKILLGASIKQSRFLHREVIEKNRNTCAVIRNSSVFMQPSLSAKNALVRYAIYFNDNEEERLTLEIRFDPTHVYNHGKSKRSVVVAKSGGWCPLNEGIMFSFYALAVTETTSTEVVEAVKRVLDPLGPVELARLTYKDVSHRVMEALGSDTDKKRELDTEMREAIIKYIRGRKRE
uniref:Uncharacterized protein TCIL3000_11_8860 n=1 Tax=Trypanosoma congolense (strain IL3000) TaxID=1068625 RepID=G0V1A8_TRYCI|nr:unnamed protein product [Trypanosoma congolense IL3000]